jgi:hypothetical protein
MFIYVGKDLGEYDKGGRPRQVDLGYYNKDGHSGGLLDQVL